MPSRLTSIDLFSGCGGLSLGLDRSGFHPLAFSELSDSAAETYTTNFGDIPRVKDITRLRGKALTEWIEALGNPVVDLVCGGPPCQGFSGIGHRRSHEVEREDIPSNHLYTDMIRIIGATKPRSFLFENVRGLISGRWTARGKKGEIWEDIRAGFRALRDYEVGWELVSASRFGVPQNRPRVLLVGLHKDYAKALAPSRDDPLCNPRGLIPEGSLRAPDLIDVLSDLEDPEFAAKGRTERYLHAPQTRFQRELRTKPNGELLTRGSILTDQVYSRHSARITAKFRLMVQGKPIRSEMRTKKFAQRALPASWEGRPPWITVTSLPDDFVHYAQPRILTVREWARLQTFPDWFEFRGPRTTGGHRRAGNPSEGNWDREVPKYTQIGNAIPVKLAEAVGAHLRELVGR